MYKYKMKKKKRDFKLAWYQNGQLPYGVRDPEVNNDGVERILVWLGIWTQPPCRVRDPEVNNDGLERIFSMVGYMDCSIKTVMPWALTGGYNNW